MQQETSILVGMESRTNSCSEVKEKVTEVRTSYAHFMHRILKRSAEIQTSIHKLKKRLELISKLYKGHNEYFAHLRGVSNLSSIYDAFIVEVVRRRQFSVRYEQVIGSLTSGVATLRENEILRREAFLSEFGSDIPAIFHSIIPSIKEKPPFFSATLTASQWLPEIYESDLSIELANRLRAEAIPSLASAEDAERLAFLEDENIQLKQELEALKKVVTNTAFASCSLANASSNAVGTPIDTIGGREMALGAAMSALSTVVHLIESSDYDGSPQAPSRSTTLGGDNCEDFTSVVELIRHFISGVKAHISELRTHVGEAQDQIADLTASLSCQEQDLSVAKSIMAMSSGEVQDDMIPKISFRSFSVKEIALFCSARLGSDAYVAFNVACPNHYLSLQSLNAFRESAKIL